MKWEASQQLREVEGFRSDPPHQNSATVKALAWSFWCNESLRVIKMYFHYGSVSMVMKEYAVLANEVSPMGCVNYC